MCCAVSQLPISGVGTTQQACQSQSVHLRCCWLLQVGQVASPGFTCAFFDMYLGANPVSADGKASIARGLARTISRAGS